MPCVALSIWRTGSPSRDVLQKELPPQLFSSPGVRVQSVSMDGTIFAGRECRDENERIVGMGIASRVTQQGTNQDWKHQALSENCSHARQSVVRGCRSLAKDDVCHRLATVATPRKPFSDKA